MAIGPGYLRQGGAGGSGAGWGGAVADIVDRAGDGAVTDFLWLGWFPALNPPDAAITLGRRRWWAGHVDEPRAAAGTDPSTAETA